MKVLVACEFSGAVRRAFRDRGHDAWSCDLEPPEDGDRHHNQCDVRAIWHGDWDLIIGFPPCTHLASSGARWFRNKRAQQQDAVQFVRDFFRTPCPRVAVENPIGVLSTAFRKPDQIIQPWQFGHGETKATCLWLKSLPRLHHTQVVEGRVARIHRMSPSPDRAKNRSRTYGGIAAAMAEQWGAA